MRHFRNILAALSITAALAVGGYIHAQPGGAGGDEPAVDLPMEKEANLTPEEMRANSEEHIKDMQSKLTRVVELQQIARKQKDVGTRPTCQGVIVFLAIERVITITANKRVTQKPPNDTVITRGPGLRHALSRVERDVDILI